MGCRAGALTDGCERQVATLALIEVPAWLSLYGVPDTKLVLLFEMDMERPTPHFISQA